MTSRALAAAPPPSSPRGGAEMFDIIARIRMRTEDGSKSERLLAAFVLAHPQDAASAPIAEIAARCGVSEPTVTRFARALGCSGVADFKFRLAQALAVGGNYLNAAPLPREEREARILQAISDGALRAVEAVRDTVDMGAVFEAADILAQAQMVLAFGSGGTSALMARETETRLFRLGLPVRAESDGQMQCMAASVAGPGTVVLAFSISGHGRPLVEAARIARGYGAAVIAVTAPGSPLAGEAGLVLPFRLAEDGNLYKPSSGRFGLLALVDILAMATAEALGPRVLEGIRRIKQTLNTMNTADPGLPVGD